MNKKSLQKGSEDQQRWKHALHKLLPLFKNSVKTADKREMVELRIKMIH